MKQWRLDKLEQLAKREKSKKSRFKKQESTQELLEVAFECAVETWPAALQKECFVARVMEVHKRYAFVSPESQTCEDNLGKHIDTRDVWLASIARRFTQAQRRERNFFAVGDRVLCRPGCQEGSEVSQDLPSCVIEHRAPRSSKIARLDPMTPEREHVLATNMTQMVIVASYVHPTVKWGLIDRYLLLAEEQNLPAVIILNKSDLLPDQKPAFQEQCRELEGVYRGLGYTVLSIQAQGPSEEDLAELKRIFTGQISFVSGHSGVGKSSLVNLLRPEINQEVEDEDILTKGRHTTTYASFIKLGVGGYVIDSPGIRSFLIQERSAIDLTWGFREFRPFLNQCRYRECTHREEPACAVRAAVQGVAISPWRYKSYLAILTGASGREGRLRDIIDDEA